MFCELLPAGKKLWSCFDICRLEWPICYCAMLCSIYSQSVLRLMLPPSHSTAILRISHKPPLQMCHNSSSSSRRPIVCTSRVIHSRTPTLRQTKHSKHFSILFRLHLLLYHLFSKFLDVCRIQTTTLAIKIPTTNLPPSIYTYVRSYSFI